MERLDGKELEILNSVFKRLLSKTPIKMSEVKSKITPVKEFAKQYGLYYKNGENSFPLAVLECIKAAQRQAIEVTLEVASEHFDFCEGTDYNVKDQINSPELKID